MFKQWCGQVMVDMKRVILRRHGQTDEAQWWVQDIEMAGSHCQLSSWAGDRKKGQGSGNMWTLRSIEKVLSLSHFSWFYSSQTEGKGLCQLTSPELVHQQNMLSLSNLSSDPKPRVHGHLAVLLWAPAGKGEERPLGHLELLNLAQGW